MNWESEEIERARLAAIVNGSEDAIVSKTLDGKITSWNPAATRIFGFEEVEMIGSPIAMIIPDELLAEEEEILRKVRSGQRVHHFNTVRLHKSGRRIDMSVTVSPLFDSSGKIVGASKIGRDITLQKRADELAAIAQERFRLIALATSDVICDWDIRANTMWWNEGLTTSFGHAPSSATAEGPDFWKSRIVPSDRDNVLRTLEDFMAGSGEKFASEYGFTRLDGSIARVVDNKFAIRDEKGATIRLLSSMVDVTERVELDNRLRQSQKLEAIGQLTGGVAHDFNNLLTVIIGTAEVLVQDLSRDDRLRMLAEMTMSAAERGAELTSRLLAFARRQPLAPRSLEIHDQLRGMEGLIRRTLPEDISIEFIRGGGLWPAVIDPGQLETAILNLVINARDAMPNGGRLTFETANVALDANYAFLNEEVAPGQYVMISLTDTGVGMDRETAVRAFDPFFTTKPVGRGSGLGLSMVYGFIKQSKGHIKIYSEVGHGTSVKLYLPRAEPGKEVHAGTNPERQVVTGTETVLLVEDDELVRDYVSGQLSSLGYKVVTAKTGPEALEILRQVKEIELLFTDVVMPGGLNGRELAQRAMSLRPNLAILFTSGYTENAIIHDGRLDPGVHLLSKPYRREDLASHIRSALDFRSIGSRTP